MMRPNRADFYIPYQDHCMYGHSKLKCHSVGKRAAVVVAVIGGLSPSPSRTCLIRTRFRNADPITDSHDGAVLAQTEG
jgi:hypothetical protein